MIKIDNIEVFNFEGALRDIRNFMNSWEKSDSIFEPMAMTIGPNDLALAQKLIAAGPEHAKFMRQIFIIMDITAPLYFTKEFDTYKVSTVRNSCSTMHKIHSKEFTLDDFSCEHLLFYDIEDPLKECHSYSVVLTHTLTALNSAREHYLKTKDKKYWWQMIQLLPSSYNQKFIWTANYQILRNIYFSRKNHKLDEWVEFCKIIETLPYAKELITLEV